MNDDDNYYGLDGLPTPAKEYIEYYKNNPDSCCGLVKVNGKWSTVHASGKIKSTSFIWKYIPSRFIKYNKKGITFTIRGK